MRLDLDRTPAGQSTLDVADRCDLGYGPGGPGEVAIAGHLRVDNLEGRCVVRGELTAAGPVVCDRCLREFTFSFAVPVELMILRDAGAGRNEAEDGDSLVLHQRDGLVDLHGSIREAAMLAVPLSRVCRADCRGLCSRCGAELNTAPCACADGDVDPRWDGLPD
jgi:uncharacterized protein